MPYIRKKFRELYADEIEYFIKFHAGKISTGELNYFISSLIHSIIEKQGLQYATVNEVVGVLECVKLELYRKIIAKYEDKKFRENGSVSELDGLTMEDVR